MVLTFKQKFFSWFDSFDIYDSTGKPVYEVRGQMSWGHMFKIYDMRGNEVGALKEVVFSFLHRFEMYKEGRQFGEIVKEFSFFQPRFTVSAEGYEVDGDWMQWDYTVRRQGRNVGSITKEIFNWTDTYRIECSPDCAIDMIMFALAIDAVKCDHQRSNMHHNYHHF